MSTTDDGGGRATATSTITNGSGGEQKESDMPNGDAAPVSGEEERTLTDHLNKKLLQSFLDRMDAGTASIPNMPDSKDDDDPEKQDFDD